MEKRLHIFVGHFGSGKTETALNFAVKNAEMGRRVCIADFDTVNPYFRTADVKGVLERMGITAAVSATACSNVDIPVLPPQINRIFTEKDIFGIFDVGGDGDGAYALGVYRHDFEKEGYAMHFVVNTKRPLTSSAEDITEYINSIENASGLRVSDIVNNTNLGRETTAEVLFSGYDEIKRVSEERGIPILYNCGTSKTLKNVTDKAFEMKIFIRMPWERGDR